MKIKKLFAMLCVIAIAGFFTQCEKFGSSRDIGEPDPDSDRPLWAGGATGENPHNKQGDGGTNGGNTVDYGDLYVLLRDVNGLPVMLDIDIYEEGEFLETIWVVQPVGVDGEPLDLDDEGGLTPESLLLAQPVDFGRLNIVRSPQSVLDQAMGEALKIIDSIDSKFTLDFCGRLTIWNKDASNVYAITKTIDSPRENMAIYQEIMNNGFSGKLAKLNGVPGIDALKLAASSFAAGSDKTGTVNIDEVVYINGFLGCNGGDDCYLENLNEYDKYHDYDWKRYFNFGECDCHLMFQYNRDVYKDRDLKILQLNADGTYDYVYKTVWEAMDDNGLFMYKWGLEYDLTLVDGFAAAVDDAVQVLEYVHGNTNIEFLPVAPAY